MSKKQTRIKTIIIPAFFVLVFFFASEAQAEDHYVTQNGTGLKNGSSVTNAWSAADFNNAAKWNAAVNTEDNLIGPGDKVYFSGVITTSITPKGSGTYDNYITLDGYKASDSFDVVRNSGAHPGACDIVLSKTSGDANRGILVIGKSYLIIQDFDISNVSGGITINGGELGAGSGYIVVRRVAVNHAYGNCIYVGYNPYSAFGVPEHITIGGSRGDGIYINECQTVSHGNCAFTINKANDIVVSYNRLMGRTSPAPEGENVIEVHQGSRVLLEYNDISNAAGDAGISIKEPQVIANNKDIIVRFNNIHDNRWGNTQMGMSIGFTHNAYVYGNYIHDNADAGIRVKEMNTGNLYVFSNVLVKNKMRGFWFDTVETGRQETGTAYFFNNILYGHTGSDNINWPNVGVFVTDILSGGTLFFKNNIIANNEPWPGAPSKVQLSVNTNDFPQVDIDYNQWYYAGKTSLENIVRTSNNVSYPMYYNVSGLGQNDAWGDPGMNDPANGDYSLKSDSKSINTGQSMGVGAIGRITITDGNGIRTSHDILWGTGLAPGTDFSTIPPTVVTANQNDYGSGWERGAYVYAPTDSISPGTPKGLSIR